MAATFFGEVVKAPSRAGTEEEEEEEEQNRRDTPEDREVRRQLARKRSGSGKASPQGECQARPRVRAGTPTPPWRPCPPSTPHLRLHRVSAGSSVYSRTVPKHTDPGSRRPGSFPLAALLHDSSFGFPRFLSPSMLFLFVFTYFVCVFGGSEVEAGGPVALFHLPFETSH